MSSSVSIVIPVYNAEKDIEKCIKSVYEQIYKNWELILVDDGSSDSSASICKKYAQLDSRIKYYLKINGGAGSARNYGIEKASGKYIMFLDSDDCWDPSCLEILMTQKSIPDLTMFTFYKIQNGSVVFEKRTDPFFSDNPERVKTFLLKMKDDSYTSEIFCFPWNKLFKTSLIKNNGIRFPLDVHLREDEIFMYRYMRFCKSVRVLDKMLYFYKLSSFGLTGRKRTAEEDVKLGDYILSETKMMECPKDFFDRQIVRALLYHFSAFMNSSDEKCKRNIFTKMNAIYSLYEYRSYKKERLIGKLVTCSLKLPAWIGFFMMRLLAYLFQRKKFGQINV